MRRLYLPDQMEVPAPMWVPGRAEGSNEQEILDAGARSRRPDGDERVAATAHGPSTQKAEGEWHYTTTLSAEPKVHGCTTVLKIDEFDDFDGTFDGGSLEEKSGRGVVVIHCSGVTTFWGPLRFDEMTVDGKTGGLVMAVRGRVAAEPGTEWTGRWVVLRASGELRGLRGSGDWWGPGAGGPGLEGEIFYDGRVRFRH